MSNYNLLCKLNPESYDHNIYADSLEFLIYDMVEFFEEYMSLSKYINVYEEDFMDENDYFDEVAYDKEVKKKLTEFIKSSIKWNGEGEYCIVDFSSEEPKIMRVDELLVYELGNVEFPITIKPELFSDTEDYILDWKKSEGYEYIYFVTFVKHVGMPEFNIAYVVYSNEKVDNVISTLNEDKGIFIGEFNILGANYNVEEVENFDIDNLEKYKFTEYEVVYLD